MSIDRTDIKPEVKVDEQKKFSTFSNLREQTINSDENRIRPLANVVAIRKLISENEARDFEENKDGVKIVGREASVKFESKDIVDKSKSNFNLTIREYSSYSTNTDKEDKVKNPQFQILLKGEPDNSGVTSVLFDREGKILSYTISDKHSKLASYNAEEFSEKIGGLLVKLKNQVIDQNKSKKSNPEEPLFTNWRS